MFSQVQYLFTFLHCFWDRLQEYFLNDLTISIILMQSHKLVHRDVFVNFVVAI